MATSSTRERTENLGQNGTSAGARALWRTVPSPANLLAQSSVLPDALRTFDEKSRVSFSPLASRSNMSLRGRWGREEIAAGTLACALVLAAGLAWARYSASRDECCDASDSRASTAPIPADPYLHAHRLPNGLRYFVRANHADANSVNAVRTLARCVSFIVPPVSTVVMLIRPPS